MDISTISEFCPAYQSSPVPSVKLSVKSAHEIIGEKSTSLDEAWYGWPTGEYKGENPYDNFSAILNNESEVYSDTDMSIHLLGQGTIDITHHRRIFGRKIAIIKIQNYLTYD